MSDSADYDAAIAAALEKYAPSIWEAGRCSGLLDAARAHGPDDEKERLLWVVMTPRFNENPYDGEPFDFAAHDETLAEEAQAAENYRAMQAAPLGEWPEGAPRVTSSAKGDAS